MRAIQLDHADPTHPASLVELDEPPGVGGGPTRHSIERAVEVLAADLLPADLLPADAVITHEFALEDHRDAIRSALDRRAGAMKVVFRP